MTVAYIDCIAGVSGDMLIGALLDAGVAEAELRARLADLRLPGFSLSVRRVQKVGIGALKVDVQVTDHATERHVPAIIDLVDQSAVARQPSSGAPRPFSAASGRWRLRFTAPPPSACTCTSWAASTPSSTWWEC